MIKFTIPLLFLAICMFSCNNDKSKLDDYYIEITNNELKDAIVEYDSVTKKEAIDPYIIKVVSESIGDTLVKYTIMCDYSPAMWDISPVLYVANVNGKDVIFCSWATDKPNNLVRQNKKMEQELVRRNFPTIYEQYISEQPYTSLEITGGYSYQLFYYKGKLILKKLQVSYISLSLVAKLIADKKIQVDDNGVKYNIDIDKYFDYWK